MIGILNIQFKPIIGDKNANLKIVEKFIDDNSDKKLDLVILPEFFSTGVSHEDFVNSPEDINGGFVISFISDLAKKYKTNIVAGTVIESDNGKLYNTSFVLDRNGSIIGKYRKIHLYNYMGGTEGERITPGNELKVVDFDFGKVGIGVCYDIRYPLHYKNLVKEGAQLIVLPTAWIVPNEIYDNKESLEYTKDMWIALNRTRAFDNMVYTISSNQCGKVNDNISALGSSVVISPTAEVLACADDDNSALYVQLELGIVDYLKSIYPISFID